MNQPVHCSDPRRHAAFGYHQLGPEGLLCASCRVLAPNKGGPGDGTGPQVNLPSFTTPAPPDQIADTHSLDASDGGHLPPAPLAAPDRPHMRHRRCPYCGTPFIPRRNDTIWCSSKCRKNASSRRRYARDRALAGLPYRPQARMAQRTPFRLLLEEDGM
jgi:predicted nucleic acid-binding Zn ribbon protein